MTGYRHHTDEELTGLLAKGDPEAFHEIYQRYWQRLYAMACIRLKRPDIAEDIVQDVFTHLWERRETLSISTLENWLATVVKYKIITLVNRRLRRELSPGEVPELSYDDNLLEQRLLAQLLQKEINKLPGKCRLVYKMSTEADATNKEIAAHFGITEKAVEKHITKARRALSLSIRNILNNLFFSLF